MALVENADGVVGDRIAVNPTDPPIDGERPVYFVGHDPTSVVRVADSFEAWVRESAAAPGRPWRYHHLYEARRASYARYRAWRSSSVATPGGRSAGGSSGDEAAGLPAMRETDSFLERVPVAAGQGA